MRGVAVQEKLYVGVDLHKTQFTICVINEEGDSFEAGTKFPMDKEGYITLLDKGREIAEKIYERHTFLTDWLTSIGVDPTVAAEDACRIEHVISAETFSAMKKNLKTK